MTDKNEKTVRIAVNARSDDEPEIAPGEVQPEEKDELEAIRQEAAGYKDKYLRAAAELENTKKRLERRYAGQAEEEKKRLLRNFLTVADNLERALAHSDRPPSIPPTLGGRGAGDASTRPPAPPILGGVKYSSPQSWGARGAGDSLRDGVQLTHQELQRLLSREGVEPLETVGQPFDPYYHEAVITIAAARDDDDEVDTVVAERERGYLYRGQLLRPAKVDVAVPASG